MTTAASTQAVSKTSCRLRKCKCAEAWGRSDVGTSNGMSSSLVSARKLLLAFPQSDSSSPVLPAQVIKAQ